MLYGLKNKEKNNIYNNILNVDIFNFNILLINNSINRKVALIMDGVKLVKNI